MLRFGFNLAAALCTVWGASHILKKQSVESALISEAAGIHDINDLAVCISQLLLRARKAKAADIASEGTVQLTGKGLVSKVPFMTTL